MITVISLAGRPKRRPSGSRGACRRPRQRQAEARGCGMPSTAGTTPRRLVTASPRGGRSVLAVRFLTRPALRHSVHLALRQSLRLALRQSLHLQTWLPAGMLRPRIGSTGQARPILGGRLKPLSDRGHPLCNPPLRHTAGNPSWAWMA